MTDQSFLLADFSGEDFRSIKPFPHPIQACVMPIVHRQGDQCRSLGTCFAISNHGLVMTARHILDDAYELDWASDTIAIDPRDLDQLGALYISTETHADNPDVHVGGLLPLQHLWAAPTSDLALALLSLPTDSLTGKRLRVPALALSPGIPTPGQYCMGVGYHRMEWNSDTNNAEYNIVQSFSASRGTIEEVYFPQRDSSLLHFPCFRVSARYEGGMSGGPVVSAAGQVCGVICSSTRTDPGIAQTSHASLVGPALALSLHTVTPNGDRTPRFLHEFVEGGAVRVDGTMRQLNVARSDLQIVIDFGEERRVLGRLSATPDV